MARKSNHSLWVPFFQLLLCFEFSPLLEVKDEGDAKVVLVAIVAIFHLCGRAWKV